MPMSADLGKPLEDYVESLVKSGRYGSKSEVLREGVRLVQEREAKQAALMEFLKPALEQVERGETIPAEEVFDELRAELLALKEGRRAG